jgi:glutathione reductase (NADPH)
MNLQKHGCSSNEGEIASPNLLRGENYKKPNHEQIPSAVFISPLLASVGVEENDAKHQGLKFKVNHINASNWHSSGDFEKSILYSRY